MDVESQSEVQETQQTLARVPCLSGETGGVVRGRCPGACAGDLGRCDSSLGWLVEVTGLRDGRCMALSCR